MLTRGNEFIAVNWCSLLDYTWNAFQRNISCRCAVKEFGYYYYYSHRRTTTGSIVEKINFTILKLARIFLTSSFQIVSQVYTCVYSEINRWKKVFLNIAVERGNLAVRETPYILLAWYHRFARSLKTFFLVKGDRKRDGRINRRYADEVVHFRDQFPRLTRTRFCSSSAI